MVVSAESGATLCSAAELLAEKRRMPMPVVEGTAERTPDAAQEEVMLPGEEEEHGWAVELEEDPRQVEPYSAVRSQLAVAGNEHRLGVAVISTLASETECEGVARCCSEGMA